MIKIEWKHIKQIGIGLFLIYLMLYHWETMEHYLWKALEVAAPLFLGCVIAYAVNILMSFYEERIPKQKLSKKLQGLHRPVCMLLAFISLVTIVMLVVRMIVPELISCIALLAEQLPAVLEQITWTLEEEFEISRYFSTELWNSLNWQNIIKNGVDWLAAGFGNAVGILSSLFSTAFTLVVGVVFSIYLLLGKEQLRDQLLRLGKAYLKPNTLNGWSYVLHTINQIFHKFIVGQCLEAVIIGLLCMLGMLLLGFPYAPMIGALVGFTALIPVAGAYIGAIVGALMILTVSPLKSVLFLVFLVILQQLEGNLIYPKVVGASVGLPGIWVLAAVTLGGGIMGIAGMLVGVPIAAVIYQLVKVDMHRRLDKREERGNES